MVNFTALKNIFNNQMDSVLASTGLTTQVTFNYGITNKDICPNCIYDPILKKSANKYKTGGPVPFTANRLCPYCNGIGYYGEETTSIGYLAIVWDYKKWINPPPDIAQPDGMIQTICSKEYLWDIKKCKDILVLYPSSSNRQQKFILYKEPEPAGLGDNNYIFAIWKKGN